MEFTPETISSRNETTNNSKNIQIKSSYDQDFRKLSNICESAILKANEVSHAKKLSNFSAEFDNNEELKTLKSNSDSQIEILNQNQINCKNFIDPPRIPKISTEADVKLNNKILFEKLTELENKVVNVSAHNQFMNQIKYFNSGKTLTSPTDT